MATEVSASGAHAIAAFRRFGPFKSSGGNLYVIGVLAPSNPTNGDTLVCFKSSDGSSWSEQDSTNRPALQRHADLSHCFVEYLDSEPDGDKVRVVFAGGGVATDYEHGVAFASFDMSSDAWEDVDSTDEEYLINVVGANEGDHETNPYVQINVRSDGDVLVAYNGTRTASKGTDYSRVYYARLESSTWTVDVAVGAGTNQHELLRGMATDSNDLSYIAYSQGGTDYYKELTSGNALDSSPTSSSLTGTESNPWYPMETATSGEAMLLGDSSSEVEVGEYTTSAESRYISSLASSVGTGIGAAWDSTNEVAAVLFGETTTFDRVYATYDPSTNAFSEEADLVGGLVYASKTLDVSTQVGTACFSVALSSDGTKAYALDPTNAVVYQYTLSTAWDISSGSYASKSADLSSEVTSAARSLRFRSDGTSFYVLDYTTSDVVYQYNLSTPWDVSTASYASKSLDVSTETVGAISFTISSDGTKAYVIDSLEDVYQYTLSTAWDISSGSYASKSYSLPTVSTGNGIQLSPDGRYFFFCNTEGGDFIYKYILSTAYDISTASEAGKSVDISGQVNLAADFCFSADGTKVYVAAGVDETIDQFSTSGFSVVGDHANVTYSLLVDGTTIRYLYTDNANDIWYDEHSLSTGATGTGTVTDGGETISGSGTVAITGTGALTDGGETVSGTGAVAITGTGALTDAGETIAGEGTVYWYGFGALTDAGETISGSGSVTVAGTGALTDAGETIAGSGTLTVAGTGAITDGGEAIAGSGTVAITGTGALTDSGEAIAGTGSLIVAGTGAVTDAGETISGSGTLTVAGTGAVTDAGEAIAGTGTVLVTGTGALTDAGETIAGEGTVSGGPVTGTGALTDAGETISGSGAVVVSGTGSLTDAGETIAGTGAVAVSGTGSLTDAGETIAGAGTLTVSGTGAITDGGETLSGAGVVLVAGTGAITDAGEAIAGTGAVAITGTGAITDGGEVINGSGAGTATGTGAITDAGEAISGSGTVAVSGTGAITDSGETLTGVGLLLITGTGAVTDGGEAIAGTGTVTWPAITGTGAITDGGEAIAGTGTVAVSGTGALVIGGETVTGVGSVLITGTGAITDGGEAIAGTGLTVERTLMYADLSFGLFGADIAAGLFEADITPGLFGADVDDGLFGGTITPGLFGADIEVDKTP